MPRWRLMKLKSRSDAARRQTLDAAPSRIALDALAHAGQFLFPRRAQFRRRQHGRRRLRRHASAGSSSWCGSRASAATARAIASSLAVATTRQRADALAVEREGLRERDRHEEVQAGVRRTGAPRRRRLRCRRRSPGRPCRGTARGCARLTTSMTCVPLAGVRSTPVGLWQQACSTTIVPAGSCSSAASMPSKSTPRVAAS